MQTGRQLRSLFAVLLMHCNPSQPLELWEQFRENICDDVAFQLRQRNIPEPTDAQTYDYGLYLLENILKKSGRRLEDFPPMPTVQDNWEAMDGNYLLAEQRNYDPVALQTLVDSNITKFSPEQTAMYNAIMQSYNQNEGKTFFVHSAGGCGKTFVLNTVAASIRAQGDVALCVASSGIASLLLEGGRTAHSRFKISIPCLESSFCGIKWNTTLGDMITVTKVIEWDEAPMHHRFNYEALDRSLKDLFNNDLQFGGLTVVLGGDFRQTLPVIPKCSRQQIVGAALCRSPLWRNTTVLHLKTNMRLDQSPKNIAFAEWLLQIGSGRNLPPDKLVTLPPQMRCQNNTVDDLIQSIYPGLSQGNKPDKYFSDRAILSCRNDDVDDLNEVLLAKCPGVARTLCSADSVVFEEGVDGSDIMPYPVEFLASLKNSGLPLAKLVLKPGVPLMLLRNLDASNGLCNGTRMILNKIQNRVLECRILGGKHAGNIVFIPRITLKPSNEDLPIPLSRRQSSSACICHDYQQIPRPVCGRYWP